MCPSSAAKSEISPSLLTPVTAEAVLWLKRRAQQHGSGFTSLCNFSAQLRDGTAAVLSLELSLNSLTKTVPGEAPVKAVLSESSTHLLSLLTACRAQARGNKRVCQQATGHSPSARCPALIRCAAAAGQQDYRDRQPQDVRILVAGATGYIGKYVVRELVSRGYQVTAFARDKSGVGGKSNKSATQKVQSSLLGTINSWDLQIELTWG